MPQRFNDEDANVLRFGAGINSRASEDQINERECTGGQNFKLDTGNDDFRRREPFDLIGTVPNAAEIRGMATLLRSDGAVSMLVQAGANVYEWDGASTFTSVGTVAATAKLRGPKEANWTLDDKVIITDINLAEEVQEWDGTTFQETTFLESDGSTAFGDFRAKYCVVDNERAFFGNVHDNGSNFPHLLVASERGTFEEIVAGGFADTERGSASGISAEAPFFLPVPQLKPINGLAFVFGLLAISQERGAFEKLTGADATDFKLAKLFEGSGASGDEAVAPITNDLIYGVAGAIESLVSTDKFGDVEFDDLSFKIADDIETYTGWTIVFNQRLKRLYCFPDSQNECWTLFTDFVGSELSGWSKYVTRHSLLFAPTCVMACRDPSDGLEYVFMGDASGNLYRMEGSGTAGDGGTHAIQAHRTSQLFSALLDAKARNMQGWFTFRKGLANTAEITTLWSGEHVSDDYLSRAFSAVSYDTPYNGSVYYSGEFYYGAEHEDRLIRQQFAVPGRSNQFQFKTQIDGVNTFAWTELGIRFEQSA